MTEPDFFLQDWFKSIPPLLFFWGIVVIWILSRLVFWVLKKYQSAGYSSESSDE